ncbi:HNH endonuclease [Rothia sp. ZJ932]|uniref:HNH endonuclease n=1 Tax=Rothia sp. ZJ932 TaxID=2810516 RepID=UPI001967D466|nr:HNH endonuclease [Rothia sp. ZJ932]QRZ61372.1 HNH endonuclease [Rothia sp. ZJ932]
MTSSADATVQRFFSYVVKGPELTSCWLWVGAIGDDGYGRFWVKEPGDKQRVYRAHRWALEHAQPVERPQQFHALHRCDNPLCVRATSGEDSHLYWGTKSQNMMDRSARGRSNFQLLGKPDPEARGKRVKAAQALRDYTKAHGYEQVKVDELMKNVLPDQGTLF